ncbi:MAG: anhydro-N-acetylmuramic acid kinase [Spongiibacteraceae bacterium]|jgi:anhydro-N-acetylmuramic acid kinase|nr:anhydro-N-acetylmuramic acid kinase [Spongiibacteraceae bacterium]
MPELYIGLMSGTSMDGIDAALVDFACHPPKQLAALTLPLPAPLRAQLAGLCLPGDDEIERMGRADRALGELLADAALAVVKAAGVEPGTVTAIGSHGQTIRHRPNGTGAFSLQIGDPATVAERTGITTVADFRRRDIAAGGQGAPLVPPFHRALFGAMTRSRVIINIGGIANITVLPAAGTLTGFDTGPGNTLLDGWIRRHQDLPYDRDGLWAASGKVHEPLLRALMGDTYFGLTAPKSTGREHFNLDWLESHLARLGGPIAAADVQATLAELTAASIAQEIAALPIHMDELFVCGGGAYNGDLLARLKRRLQPRRLATTAELGLEPEWVEAVAFAWLARQTMERKPGNEPAVTGAAHYRILGAIHPA